MSYVIIFCFANPFLTLHKKWYQNLQETANLDTFTGEIRNRKLHFCAVEQSSCYWVIIKKAVKIIWFPIIWMGDEILKNHRRELKDFPVKIGMVKKWVRECVGVKFLHLLYWLHFNIQMPREITQKKLQGEFIYSSSKLLQAMLKWKIGRVKPTEVLKCLFVFNCFCLLNMQDSFISSIF